MNKRFSLNKEDLKAGAINALWFLAPVVLIYLYSVINIISEPGCVIGWEVFVPTNAVIIAMVLWVLNRFVDFFRRFMKG